MDCVYIKSNAVDPKGYFGLNDGNVAHMGGLPKMVHNAHILVH